jgi:choline dehydrogenase-like flavoprotein
MGGSSVLNAMLYVRGNRNDYDLWSKEGAVGWGWEEVFPYFLKSEDNRDPQLAYNGKRTHTFLCLFLIDRKLVTSAFAKSLESHLNRER